MLDQDIRELVMRFQSGNRDAFAILVKRFQNLVTSVALANTGDLQRSEDIAQQTFLIAWQKQTELRDPDRIGGWLRSIAQNVARNDRRLKAHIDQQRSLPISGAAEPTTSMTPDQVSSRREQNELLWSTLDQIPIGYREPLILFYREQKSIATVADQLGLSQDAVKQRLKRGRAMVKNEIENRVERWLIDTKPSEAFSASVIAALPAIGSIVGSTAAKAGAALGGKVTAGKVAGVVSSTGTTVGLVGILGGLSGALIGIGGAWMATRNGIKHSTSVEEAELHKSLFVRSIALSSFFILAMFSLPFVAAGWRPVLWGVSMILFFAILVWMIFKFNSQQKQLHQKYGAPKFGFDKAGNRINSNLRIPSVTVTRLNAIGMLAGIWMWLIVITSIRQAYVLLTIAAFVLAWQCMRAYTTALEQTTAGDLLRYNAWLCFFATTVQAAIVFVGVMWGGQQFNEPYNGFPIWGLGFVVFLFGAGMAGFLVSRAKKIERCELTSSDGKHC